MTEIGSPSASAGDRRQAPRSRFDIVKDLLHAGLRAIGHHASSFYTAFGIFVIAGALIALAGTLAFAEVAEHIRGDAMFPFDVSIMNWMGAHRVHWIEVGLVSLTALGTGVVVMTIALISALFLRLTEHRYSALLLLITTAGGIILNNLLKLGYSRPRPHIFPWATTAVSSSFPSGHAMSSAIVYSTVSLLAARLAKRKATRWLLVVFALFMILVIGTSRVYLGVHYPSDVLAGTLIGLAWAGFCMAGLEAVHVFARRYQPAVLEHERDLSKTERRAEGFQE
jgi:undecaprenyl-diphosphatase